MSTLQPMLAQLARELPVGDYLYEPKWDGFRCLAFVRAGEVELWSRHERPFGRYFPEIVEALRPLGDATLDGELVVPGDFGALMNRVHPAQKRVELLARTTPASFVLFDLLTHGERDLSQRPFAERRAALEKLYVQPPLAVTPLTDNPLLAKAWLAGAVGIDGVMAKQRSSTYQPGKRGWIKVKEEHTVECVVAGFRAFETGVASLLLGLYEGEELVHVGVSSQFRARERRDLLQQLMPLVVPLRGHPWERGFNLGNSPIGRLPGSAGRWVAGEMTQDWNPLRPVLVAEVAYDKLDGFRFRHPARFLRFRPDRAPQSCLLSQLC